MIKSEVQLAYQAALACLTRREYCEAELRAKLLQRGCDAIAIDSALERLKDYGYLSDVRYAEAFLRYRLKKGEALWLISSQARQKGVDEAAWTQALADVEEDYDAKQACLAVLRKRDPQQRWRSDIKMKQRQIRYLKNKGFDAATVMQALNDEGEA